VGVSIIIVGGLDGLRLGVAVLTIGNVGEPLGIEDGYGDGLVVVGLTVGDVVGTDDGAFVGDRVTGGAVGDVVGEEDGTTVGTCVVGAVVGVEVM